MSTIVYFYKNPLTWCVLLLLIQVWVAFIMSPTNQEASFQSVAYEDALESVKHNSKLSQFIENQNASLSHNREVITALTDMQKFIGGFTAFFLFLFLLLSYRRELRKE